ncbi:MAG TPA: TlpA disulfide reductase family protein [Candidatus Dormibacteraeota bacterium]|nr:TlpA disulfide reductase family protein [Candidatus Dormibacteraeota bacterium]
MTAERPTFRHEPTRHGLVGPFSGRQLIAAGLVVVAVTVVLLVATRPLGNTADVGRPDPQATAYVIGAATEGLQPGQVAPELAVRRSDGTAYQLTDLEGKPVRLADLRGRGVWIDFWASWCPPCQAETPVVRDVAAAYASKGLTVIGISVQETSVDDVRAYAQRYGLGYTVAADLSADIFHAYRVYALPTQFFIGPDGVIRDVVQGPLDMAGATAEVERILPGAGSASGSAGASPSGR